MPMPLGDPYFNTIRGDASNVILRRLEKILEEEVDDRQTDYLIQGETEDDIFIQQWISQKFAEKDVKKVYSLRANTDHFIIYGYANLLIRIDDNGLAHVKGSNEWIEKIWKVRYVKEE